MQADTKIRVACPTDNIDTLVPFYRDGLGFDVLYRFEDHAGFDGVMLGTPGSTVHFEFTRVGTHTAGPAPTQDNLVVFYLPDADGWRAAVARMEAAGFVAVAAFNPCWDQHGKTFEDPDGYRIVLQNAV